LSERSDWEEWLNKSRREIDRLSGLISSAESKTDEIVYQLFDLSKNEIELLEANVKFDSR